LNTGSIEKMTDILVEIREAGEHFSHLRWDEALQHTSHAVNDFHKLCGMEAYAPTGNFPN